MVAPHKLIAYDELPGLACLARLPPVEPYHSIEAAKGHTDKPMRVAFVDMFEVAQWLDIVEVVLLARVLVGIQLTPFAVVQGHNSHEGIVRMGGRTGRRGLQVEFDLWEIDTPKAFEGIVIAVCIVPSSKRNHDPLMAENSSSSCLSFDLLERRPVLCFQHCA